MAEADETKIVTTKPEEVQEEETEETDPEEPENDGDDDDPDGDDDTPDDQEPVVQPKVEVDSDGLAVVPGETPRERALRMELVKERKKNATNLGKDIIQPAPVEKKQISTKSSEILKKYKPEEIESLREVLPALAEELGFVKKDELQATTYEEKANVEIQSFIKDHPEYASENDPEGVLWTQLKDEYQAYYKPPQNPSDYRKIFERIHKDLMGINTTGKKLPTVQAAKEKINVASHRGPAASATSRNNGVRPATGGLRTDALKGFSAEEIADIEGRA